MEYVNKCNMKLISYNCRGFNSYKSVYICHLLQTCDILFLQEHWLSEGQLSILDSVSGTHSASGICGFDSKQVLTGRPYGGCAIFWRRDWGMHVSVVDTKHNRVCAIRLYNADVNLLLVNVYMPCESDEVAHDDFCSVLSVVASISESFPDAMLILGGDLNVDISRDTTHTSEFVRFCRELNMLSVNQHPKSKVDFTYFNMKRFSIIDHFVLPAYIFERCIDQVAVIHDNI